MKNQELVRKIVASLFKDDLGEPLILSDGQLLIFLSIFLKKDPRVQIIAPTQYGKSLTIAIAIILRTQAMREDFAIVAGSQPKADIIMEKVIQHTFDNKKIYSQLDIDAKEPLEKLKRERSKKRITWKGGGEVRTFSGDARNRQKTKEALMGFGSPNIVEDESALIEDDLHSTVMRMLGGHGGGFLLKIGNPSYRDAPNSHFYKTWSNPRYKRIFIDYKQAIKEGRYTEEYIEEMREEMSEEFFRIYYECDFPKEETIDTQGYYRLFSDSLLEMSIKKVDWGGRKRIAFDIGEGSDANAAVLRDDKFATIKQNEKIKDTMVAVTRCKELIDDNGVRDEDSFIDAIGVGVGVYNRMKELDRDIVPVKWSEKPTDKYDDTKSYKNLKAQNFFDAARWLRKGGKLDPDCDWSELKVIKWKEDSDGTIKIKPKQELRKEGIKSPNVADAFVMTFNRPLEDSAPKIHVL